MNRGITGALCALGIGLGVVAACDAPTGMNQAGEAAALTLQPCEAPGVDGSALCGVFEVHEDRERASGRLIGLNVMVLPAQGETRARDPIFVLAGGPGEAATALAALVADSFAELRETHDIVMVDQRGTGKSNSLQCDMGDLDERIRALTMFDISEERLEACLASLSGHADVRHYTTPYAMDDIDDVRAALGYERINLYGGSYGTRSAFVYLRRHPERIRSAVLRAIAPVDMKALLPAARHGQVAFDGLVADCLSDAACAAAYPDLDGMFATVLARLAAAPVTVEAANPFTGDAEPVTVTRDVFAGAIPFLLADTNGAAITPMIIAAAHQGNFDVFASVVAPAAAGMTSALSVGMLLTVICSEDAMAINPAEIENETAGTFMGPVRVDNQLRVCRSWPRGPIPADYHRPVSSNVPVLMISGEYDPIDGLDLAEDAGSHLSRAVHVVIPSGTHQPQFPGCLQALAQDFIRAGSGEGLDVSCVARMGRGPFQVPGAP
jgi:pimeloyl-ACP methyl ester carboxylesterase